MSNHGFLEAAKRLTIIDRADRAAQPELPEVASDGATIHVGPDLHDRASCPGISRAIARRSSVASFRYGIVASVDRCPSMSPMTFCGTAARSKLTARACRKI